IQNNISYHTEYFKDFIKPFNSEREKELKEIWEKVTKKAEQKKTGCEKEELISRVSICLDNQSSSPKLAEMRKKSFLGLIQGAIKSYFSKK
ncbi:MAG TPA: hypothetical protein VI959_01310, partial [Alphaproteobacteria bacterium]|nr:hypothetical protein [Alphaproteobacteria bacterium]